MVLHKAMPREASRKTRYTRQARTKRASSVVYPRRYEGFSPEAQTKRSMSESRRRHARPDAAITSAEPAFAIYFDAGSASASRRADAPPR
jgi:hypothetical protein